MVLLCWVLGTYLLTQSDLWLSQNLAKTKNFGTSRELRTCFEFRVLFRITYFEFLVLFRITSFEFLVLFRITNFEFLVLFRITSFKFLASTRIFSFCLILGLLNNQFWQKIYPWNQQIKGFDISKNSRSWQGPFKWKKIICKLWIIKQNVPKIALFFEKLFTRSICTTVIRWKWGVMGVTSWLRCFYYEIWLHS